MPHIKYNYVDRNGKVYDYVIDKQYTKDELFEIGKFKYESKNDSNAFDMKEHPVYIYQDNNNPKLGYRIYSEFSDYGFNGYRDEVLINELNKRKNGVHLTDFPLGVVTCNSLIIGQIIPFYDNTISLLNLAKSCKDIDYKKIYMQILNILEELYNNGIAYTDVNPGNFVVDSNLNVHIIDFDKELVLFKDINDKSNFYIQSVIQSFLSMILKINSITGQSNYNNDDLYEINNFSELKEKMFMKGKSM